MGQKGSRLENFLHEKPKNEKKIVGLTFQCFFSQKMQNARVQARSKMFREYLAIILEMLLRYLCIIMLFNAQHQKYNSSLVTDPCLSTRGKNKAF